MSLRFDLPPNMLSNKMDSCYIFSSPTAQALSRGKTDFQFLFHSFSHLLEIFEIHLHVSWNRNSIKANLVDSASRLNQESWLFLMEVAVYELISQRLNWKQMPLQHLSENIPTTSLFSPFPVLLFAEKISLPPCMTKHLEMIHAVKLLISRSVEL